MLLEQTERSAEQVEYLASSKRTMGRRMAGPTSMIACLWCGMPARRSSSKAISPKCNEAAYVFWLIFAKLTLYALHSSLSFEGPIGRRGASTPASGQKTGHQNKLQVGVDWPGGHT